MLYIIAKDCVNIKFAGGKHNSRAPTATIFLDKRKLRWYNITDWSVTN